METYQRAGEGADLGRHCEIQRSSEEQENSSGWCSQSGFREVVEWSWAAVEWEDEKEETVSGANLKQIFCWEGAVKEDQ